MTATYLSFSLKQTTRLGRWVVVIVAVLGFSFPVLYFAWWTFGGGSDREIRRNIESLRQLDPIEAAEAAFASVDHRLYLTGPLLESHAPGLGPRDKAWTTIFGYRGFTLYHQPNPGSAERGLNDFALSWLTAYNRALYDLVVAADPDWHERYQPQHRHRHD
ncbi:MAG: hypothetical protein EA425_17415 [Puniceicoccaceae bacterium]|nr:MAG: hypothetical protein EA425_17415 [Puniceicoccaceae bacterium]